MPEPYVPVPEAVCLARGDGQDLGHGRHQAIESLIIMRHAKTEQSAGSDRARKLTSRGRADARAGGRWLPRQAASSRCWSSRHRPHEPGLRLTSSLLSSTDTPEIRSIDDLYGASASEVVEIVGVDRPGGGAVVLVVGHNPTMEDLAYRLQVNPTDPWAPHLPTAGLVVLRLPGEWAELAVGTAELLQSHVPRG